MAHPQTNYNPPFNITRASHLVFTARDLKASKAFYTEVIGLVVSDETDDTVWLHGVEERCHHSLTLKKNKERTGLRTRRLSRFHRRRSRQGQGAFRPPGHRSAFRRCAVPGPHLACRRLRRHAVGIGRDPTVALRTQTKVHTHKGAGALRMDHYQLLVPDVAAAAKFYLDLGFRVSDYTVLGDDKIVAIFLHRKDNPHDMVLLQRSGPRFHHYGYIVQEMHHVVRALDIAGNIGFGDNLEHGPGRHGERSLLLRLLSRSRWSPRRTSAAGDADHRHRRRADALQRHAGPQYQFVGPAAAASRGLRRRRHSGRRASHAARGRGRAVFVGKISVCKRPEAAAAE